MTGTPGQAGILVHDGKGHAVAEVENLLRLGRKLLVSAEPVLKKSTNRDSALIDADPQRRHNPTLASGAKKLGVESNSRSFADSMLLRTSSTDSGVVGSSGIVRLSIPDPLLSEPGERLAGTAFTERCGTLRADARQRSCWSFALLSAASAQWRPLSHETTIAEARCCAAALTRRLRPSSAGPPRAVHLCGVQLLSGLVALGARVGQRVEHAAQHRVDRPSPWPDDPWLAPLYATHDRLAGDGRREPLVQRFWEFESISFASSSASIARWTISVSMKPK